VTDSNSVDPERAGSEECEPVGPKVTDKRRLDPVTGAVRPTGSESGVSEEKVAGGEAIDLAEVVEAIELAELVDAMDAAEVPEEPGVIETEAVKAEAKAVKAEAVKAEAVEIIDADVVAEGDDLHPDTTLAADLTRDLQRLQAEYVNYKKRVDRDRALHRDLAVGSVIEALLPVLDDIHLARQHGDLEGGPFAAIADKLDATVAKFGVQRFGQPGDAFDPMLHEALMHSEAELADGTTVTTVVQVLQPGYRLGERLIRAARVAVADPQT
jgi:molecular chaperone GrpE